MPKVLNLLCSLLEFWSSNTYKTKNPEHKLDCDVTLLKVYSDMEKIDSFTALLQDPSLKSMPIGYASTFFEQKQRPEPLSVIYAIEGQVSIDLHPSLLLIFRSFSLPLTFLSFLLFPVFVLPHFAD